MGYKLKTKSVWPYPKPRFFKFLNKIEVDNLPKNLCVIGCADGTYVLPAAKRGFDVTAIDIDTEAINGGADILIDGLYYKNIGLRKRLELETDIVDKVEIFNIDYMDYTPTKTFSLIFTSGSLHYDNNSKYSIHELISKMLSMLSINGILLLEYIHQSSPSERHFLNKKQVDELFEKFDNVEIISHKVKKYIEKPNSRDNTIHEISWGRVYVKKVK